MTAPETTSAEPPQEPAAATPEAAAKKTLEDSLASLDEQTRTFVLGEVRSARNENQSLRARLKEAEPIVQQWSELEAASKSDLEKAQEAISTANARATQLVDRAVKAEIKALAADTFADPSDAHAFLETSKYASDEGDVDTEAIKADLADLLTRKPHLAKAQGMRPNPAQGMTGESQRPSLDAEIDAALKAGEFQKAIALKQQRAAENRAKA